MEKIKVEKTGIPPLLCWDIYADWLNKELGNTVIKQKRTGRKKKQE